MRACSFLALAVVSATMIAVPAPVTAEGGNALVERERAAAARDRAHQDFIPAEGPLEIHVHFNGLAMKIDSVDPAGNS